ncbi:hypothetical protein A176_000356 [Myxococcus hansupus]|uniref:DUF1826 domain-containing protein n=1 Tax=Pseudomyxococcus hansupus TaxID=1297742 RepID=A0A0H4WL39_9BACT|nr:DUF1826 domain-containing protein [Myxococcus hansupus]AKQ63444.1 hypothetical protein A176_000356 [Myxococcus hansupus]
MPPAHALPAHPEETQAFVWTPEALTDIYREGLNLCVWRRGFDAPLTHWLNEVTATHALNVIARVRGDAPDLRPRLEGLPQGPLFEAWLAGVHFLARLYADLFGAAELGVRLQILGEDICPSFHVDRVGVRLLCTYAGPPTEWLENAHVLRGARGPTARPGAPVRALERFDVALLKGESWPDNRGNGAVHRSPAIAGSGRRRLFLSIEAL